MSSPCGRSCDEYADVGMVACLECEDLKAINLNEWREGKWLKVGAIVALAILLSVGYVTGACQMNASVCTHVHEE